MNPRCRSEAHKGGTHFTFSALLGRAFAWVLTAVRGGAGQTTLAHYQATFEPLLYGVALVDILMPFLKETGPAARAPVPASVS